MPTTERPALFEPTGKNNSPRLEWLLTANQRDYNAASLCRTNHEELARDMLPSPLTAPQVFARLGLLLGTVPPSALFGRSLLSMAESNTDNLFALTLLALAMNTVCAFVGYVMGRNAANYVLELRDTNLLKALPAYALIGFFWAAITGAAGGLLFFGIGALIGPFFALPVGLLAFTLFGTWHRWLEQGGLMSARHFWPLALGLVLSIAVLIGRMPL